MPRKGNSVFYIQLYTECRDVMITCCSLAEAQPLQCDPHLWLYPELYVHPIGPKVCVHNLVHALHI